MRFFVFVFNSMYIHICIVIEKLFRNHNQKQPMNQTDSKYMKGLRQLLGLCLLYMVVISADAQSARLWEKSYGNDKTSEIHSIVSKPNGDYMMAGWIDNGNQGDEQVYVIRTDVDGDLVWEKLLGGDRTDRAYDMVATPDGIVLAGDKNESFGQPLNILVMKVSESGELLWERNYGQTGRDQARAIISTPDGGFLVTGESDSYGNGDLDMFLLKLNGNGDSEWIKTFDNNGENDFGKDVVLKADGSGYVVMGSSGNVSADIFLVETDLNGDDVNRSVLDRPSNLEPTSIVANNNSYVVAGGFFENGIRAFITEFDLNLNEVSNKFFGNGIEQQFNDLLKTSNGNYAAAGFYLENADSKLRTFMVLLDENLNFIGDSTQIIGNETNSMFLNAIVEETAFRGGFAFAGNTTPDFIITDALFIRTNESLYIPQKFIEGRVFADNGNCIFQAGERPLSNWIVTLEGSNETLRATTDEDGKYFFRVDEGEYTVNLKVDNETWEPCFNNRIIDITGTVDSFNFNFPVTTEHECAYMEIDISAPNLVICEASNYQVQYCNKGTVNAANATIEVELDENLTVNTATLPFTRSENIYTFEIGQVNAGDCGELIINASLDCNDPVLGQTHSVIARITPDSICVPASANWDGSSIAVGAVCENDSVKFTIKNVGNTGIQGRQTLVIEDEIFIRPAPVDIPTGDSTILSFEGIGKTWRVIVPQDENHPGKSNPTIAIEGCDDSGSITTGHITRFEEDEKNPFVAVEPIENEENSNTDFTNLRGYPKGVQDSLITSKTDLEYHFRFQNVGSDTLRRVVVRDTISQNLDITSVRFGASSHPYTFKVYETGVVKFIFDDVNLPPAVQNFAASKGFVKFKISQKPNNPEGTVINNHVSLNKDFEKVQFSNLTTHVIGGTQLTDFIEVYTDLGEVFYPGVEVNVFPNPFFESATIEVKGPSFKKYEFEVYDVSGKTVVTNAQFQNRFTLEKNDLPKGLYFYRVTGDDNLLNTGKIVVQ